MNLERRLAALILTDDPFTADDITRDGELSLDPTHAPNSRQSGIGAFFQRSSKQGLIVTNGSVVRSKAPHRKGGAVRVWEATPKGRSWAEQVLR